jgi:hypothetical protein
LFYLAYSDVVAGVDAAVGEDSSPYPTENRSQSSVYADGRLCFGCDNAFVYALNSSSGSAEWRIHSWEVSRAPRGRPRCQETVSCSKGTITGNTAFTKTMAAASCRLCLRLVHRSMWRPETFSCFLPAMKAGYTLRQSTYTSHHAYSLSIFNPITFARFHQPDLFAEDLAVVEEFFGGTSAS